MFQLTDQMNTAIATLKSQHGLNEDQVNAIVGQAVAPLKASIDQITNSEKSDEDKLADVTSAVTEFVTAFAGSTGPTPAPAPSPEPAPAPSPEPATI